MPKPMTATGAANASYLNNQEEVLEKLARLKEHLKVHAQRQSKQPWNWGFAGDLQNLNARLDDILSGFEAKRSHEGTAR